MSDAPKGPRKVRLSQPIKNGKEEISELDFGEVDLGVLQDIDIVFEIDAGDAESGKPRAFKIRVDLGHIPRLISNMADIPYSAAKRVSFADAFRIGNELLDFIVPSPGTGGK